MFTPRWVGGHGAVFVTCAGVPRHILYLLTLVFQDAHLSPKASATEAVPAVGSTIAGGFIFMALKIGCFLCFLLSLVVFTHEVNIYWACNRA